MSVFRIKVHLDHLGMLNSAAQTPHTRVAPRGEHPDRPREDAVYAGPTQCNFRVSPIVNQFFEQVHGKPTLFDFYSSAIRKRHDFGCGARLKLVALIHVEFRGLTELTIQWFSFKRVQALERPEGLVEHKP
jgi:hypothetical protein